MNLTKNVILFILLSIAIGSLAALDFSHAQGTLELEREIELEDVDYSCSNLLKTFTIDELYHVETENGDFYAQARVEYGGLTFDFRLKGKQGERHSELSGREQFDRIMSHFRGQFTHIVGYWQLKDKVDSDNLRMFRKGIADGKSPKDAALGTWTGQRAKEIGYDQPRVRLNRLEGPDPRVEVEFWPSK
jgi:hypothetical protein